MPDAASVTRSKHSGDTMVRLHLGKGVLVILTMAEYTRALRRGKAERRAVRRQAHLAYAQAVQEARQLAWIRDET